MRLRWIPVVCGLLAVLAGISMASLQSAPYQHRVTALVHLAGEDPLSPVALQTDPRFALVPQGAHYDGVYFYAIARDPLARGREHTLIDDAPYRYGHAGLGELAFLLSLGRPGSIPRALLILNLVGFGFAAWAASTIAGALRRTPWAGLLIVLAPGLLGAVATDTSEPVSAGLLGVGLVACLRGRYRLACLAFIPMCFTKEPLVLVPAAVGLWLIIGAFRSRQWKSLVPTLALLAAGPVLFIAWLVYLTGRFHHSPLSNGQGRLGVPGKGFLNSMRYAAGFVQGSSDAAQIGATALPLIFVVLCGLLVGIVVVLRRPSLLGVVYLPMAAVALTLAPLAITYPKDILRTTLIPLLLLPAVLAGQPGLPLGHDTGRG